MDLALQENNNKLGQIRYRYKWVLVSEFKGKWFFLCKICIIEQLVLINISKFYNTQWKTLEISKIRGLFK